MLTVSNPDTEVVKRWLATALKGADTGRKAELASYCNVKPQAVSGWLKTGRITKKNLELAQQFLGSSPSFTSSGIKAREPLSGQHHVRWPFKFIDYDLVDQLKPDQKLLVEGAWLNAAKNLGFSLNKPVAA